MSRSGCSRRQLLRAGGVAAVAGAAAAGGSACGSDDGPGGTARSGPDGGFRVPLADTAVGESTYYHDHMVVVTQPTEGTFLAFDAVCPHEGCGVSTTNNAGHLVCPCHNSRFAPESGDVLGGPADTGLSPLDATTEGEELVIRG